MLRRCDTRSETPQCVRGVRRAAGGATPLERELEAMVRRESQRAPAAPARMEVVPKIATTTNNSITVEAGGSEFTLNTDMLKSEAGRATIREFLTARIAELRAD